MAWTGISRQKITRPNTTSRPQKRSFASAYAQGSATTTWIRKIETVTSTPFSM